MTANPNTKAYGQTAVDSGTVVGIQNDDPLTFTFSSAGDGPTAVPGQYPISYTESGPATKEADYSIVYTGAYVTVGAASGSAFILSTSASGAVNASGSADVAFPNGLFVDSSSPTAVKASGAAQVQVGQTLDVVGGVSTSGSAKASRTGGAPDDRRSLLDAAAAERGRPDLPRAVNVSGSSVTSLPPGIYTSISVSGGGQATLTTGGTYIIEGGADRLGRRQSDGHQSLPLQCRQPVQRHDRRRQLRRRHSQRERHDQPLADDQRAVYGRGPVPVAVQHPGAGRQRQRRRRDQRRPLCPGGGGEHQRQRHAQGELVAATLTVSGGAGAFELSDGSDSAYDASTANWVTDPVLTVAAEDDTGAGPDPAEVADLGAAMTDLNQRSPPSASICTGCRPARRPTSLSTSPRPRPRGGTSDGVLGFTTPSNDVYLVAGWNYFTGSDPSGIGADQYDFTTLAIHELAHTVGLGESQDPKSVMYEYLAPGTVRRSFTDTNLTAINTDADRFMKAAGAPVTVARPSPSGPPPRPSRLPRRPRLRLQPWPWLRPGSPRRGRRPPASCPWCPSPIAWRPASWPRPRSRPRPPLPPRPARPHPRAGAVPVTGIPPAPSPWLTGRGRNRSIGSACDRSAGGPSPPSRAPATSARKRPSRDPTCSPNALASPTRRMTAT